jgi:tetratricopeptide (TPR) repeat protein
MFSSRNIHFAILGLIVGASAGYVFAFYQAESSLPVVADAGPEGLPSGHPGGDEQTLELLRKAVEANPNDPETATRYANSLFSLGRLEEALKLYGKVLELQPDNLDVRSLRGAIYWRTERIAEADADLQAALRQDPNHIPALYGMFLLSVQKRDLQKAAELLKKVESLDPTYEGLPDLRNRLEEERRKAK